MKEKEKNKILGKINLSFLNEKVKNIKFDDLKKTLNQSDKIIELFKNNSELYQYFEDVKILIQLVRDFWDRKYTEIPYWSITAIVFALLYVMNPVDLIPDFIPLAGFVDDAAVIGLVLKVIREDLVKYKNWKERNKVDNENS